MDHFPKAFSNMAIGLYFILLIVISIAFSNYALSFQWIIWGTAEVLLFFYFAANFPSGLRFASDRKFPQKLFWTAFAIRFVYVIFSYYYYLDVNGVPFEYGGIGDAQNYHSRAIWINLIWDNQNYKEYWNLVDEGLSDVGYPTYLAVLYRITNSSIIVARFVKALLSAYTCVMVYKLASRNFGEKIGRMASIFCMVMPNLIYYCGLHVKETEMTFLLILFVEKADFAMHGNKIQIRPLVVALVAATALFTFRTALGGVAIAALLVPVALASRKAMALWKKIGVSLVVLAILFFSTGSQIREEVDELWEGRTSNQETSLDWRTNRKGGNSFSRYASAAVFAPLIFTIPFPTMVETPDQENQRIIHGGNYVKNITSGLTIFALFSLLFSKEWRKRVFPLAVLCGYLGVITFSAFAHSERFHLPVLPLALMFAAYGVGQLKPKHRKWFGVWLVIMFAANIIWAWFKLAGRGLI